MRYKISEYREHSEFDTFETAIAYMKSKGFYEDGEDGLLWIQSNDHAEMFEFRVLNELKINHESMRLIYIDVETDIENEWCSSMSKWFERDSEDNYKDEDFFDEVGTEVEQVHFERRSRKLNELDI